MFGYQGNLFGYQGIRMFGYRGNLFGYQGMRMFGYRGNLFGYQGNKNYLDNRPFCSVIKVNSIYLDNQTKWSVIEVICSVIEVTKRSVIEVIRLSR